MTVRLLIRFSTHPGQSLHVTGSLPELGLWSAENSKPMKYLNEHFWMIEFELIDKEIASFTYAYLLKNEQGLSIMEWGRDRVLEIARIPGKTVECIDTWNHAGSVENAFYSAPFQKVFFSDVVAPSFKPLSYRQSTHQFQVKAPLVGKGQVVCLLGNLPELGNWDTTKALLLNKNDDWWTIRVQIPEGIPSIEYKYGLYDQQKDKFLEYEGGANRSFINSADKSVYQVLRDGFIRVDNSWWKGCGVAIPVFSLRSAQSAGVGEFNDLLLLVDWVKKLGIKLIQILPVNDTTSTHTWMDSYPYSAISAFALHPIYLNLESMTGGRFQEILSPSQLKRQELNSLPKVDYEGVMNYKLPLLEKLFVVMKEETFSSVEYRSFFADNQDWLIPYAAFCFLRDKYKSADFQQWENYSCYHPDKIKELSAPTQKHYDKIAFHYFLQYHLHVQLKKAHDYANQNGIIVKGDIPIGVNRNGVDAWVSPDLYNMDLQAGAPPDDFAVKGQNWGFPTYNWEKMKLDDYHWWKRRFEQMSRYFDAFRIDHILGFFRIWSIPSHAVEGIMGHFVPSIPLLPEEFEAIGLCLDQQRFCQPYITDAVLWEHFGSEEKKFKPFLIDRKNGFYELKPAFDTQKKVEKYFENYKQDEENLRIRNGLFDLISNVILFAELREGKQVFHFRFHMEKTSSFRHLDADVKQKLVPLYIDYFFQRQDDFWRKEAMEKLPALKKASDMLICGEDLGLVPACVPDVMEQLGFLSLEIQRMPKKYGNSFSRVQDAPYLSVVTPSTHDMSTIRGWWEEERNRTQQFFQHEMGQYGEAPAHCEAWINKAIVWQHLYSPAMWSVFQIQDLLGMDELLRRKNPEEERINIPANSKHYWQYRLHLCLEKLNANEAFNSTLSYMIRTSGRA